MKTNKIKLFSLAVLIFIISACVWYLPIKYKGFPPQPIQRNLVLARNLHLADAYSYENKMGVFLTTHHIKNQGVSESPANKLTALMYAKIYDLIGYSLDYAILITILVFSLVNAILFIFFSHLKNVKFGLMTSSLTIFIPIIWQAAIAPGFYEWGVLFFSLGFVFYWLSRQKKSTYSLAFLFVSSLFFILSFWSRSAFLISIAIICLFELIKTRKIMRLIVLGLPLILLIALPLTVSYFENDTTYIKYSSSASYGHCFPDAYTYLFARQEHIKEISDTARGDVLMCLRVYDYQLSLKENASIIFDSTKFYLREPLRIITYGGPLIWFLILIGLINLKKQNKDLFQLFCLWLPFLFVALILMRTSNWDHLLEIWIPIIFLITIGVERIYYMIVNHNSLKLKSNYKYVLFVIFYLALIGHLILSSKWMFHEEYNTSGTNTLVQKAEIVNHTFIKDNAVISLANESAMKLNYLTNKNFINFNPQTIKKLIDQNKLEEVLEKFGISHAFGYDQKISAQLQNFGIQIIQ